jgi:hypothetical protein
MYCPDFAIYGQRLPAEKNPAANAPRAEVTRES